MPRCRKPGCLSHGQPRPPLSRKHGQPGDRTVRGLSEGTLQVRGNYADFLEKGKSDYLMQRAEAGGTAGQQGAARDRMAAPRAQGRTTKARLPD